MADKKKKANKPEPVDGLLPCPFCGGYDIGNRYVETYSCDSSYDIFGCEDCGANFNNDNQTGPALWNQRVAATAVQGEPVAYAVFASNGKIRIWCADQVRVETLRQQYGEALQPLYTSPQPAEQKLEPDVSALVEALEPFANCAEQISDGEDDDEWAKFRLTVGDYRKARAAIAAHRKQQENDNE